MFEFTRLIFHLEPLHSQSVAGSREEVSNTESLERAPEGVGVGVPLLADRWVDDCTNRQEDERSLWEEVLRLVGQIWLLQLF